MSEQIIPMSKGEIKQLDIVLAKVKEKFRTSIQEKMMNEAFAMASVLNYDNDVILVEVKYGVNIAIPELCFKKNVGIDRHGMEVMEEKEFYA